MRTSTFKPLTQGRLAFWVLGIATAVGLAEASLSQCRFHFGRPFTGAIPKDQIPELDYVSQWAGYTEAYNMGGMMKACKAGGTLAGKTPVVYSYIIAFTLRNNFGLQDCDVGTPSLCQQGAQKLRDAAVKKKILEVYANYAKGTATDFGTGEPVVWLMEPDFYQYAQPGSQSGNPLSFSEAASLMHELIATVKASLPNAQFSLDISPWTTDQGQTQKYYTSFDLSKFTYMHTSGGRARPDGSTGSAAITNNKMTYTEIYNLTKKPILADCGYAVGGASTGHNTAWDDPNNLNNRIQDGVIGINQANAKTDWAATLTSIRSKLQTPKACPAVTGLAGGRKLFIESIDAATPQAGRMFRGVGMRRGSSAKSSPSWLDAHNRLITVDGVQRGLHPGFSPD